MTNIQVTLLNFTITQEGLSDQLLSVAVAEEKPDLEAQRQHLVVESAANKAKLASIETRILQVCMSICKFYNDGCSLLFVARHTRHKFSTGRSQFCRC